MKHVVKIMRTVRVLLCILWFGNVTVRLTHTLYDYRRNISLQDDIDCFKNNIVLKMLRLDTI